MPVPQRLATALGVELQGLTGEDGARLNQILWRLEREVHRAPRDVELCVAHNHALACAGRASDARREAQRALELIRNRRDVPAFMVLNVAGALMDAGLVDDAKACIERVYQQPPLNPEYQSLLRHHELGIALRFGELDGSEIRLGSTEYLSFVRARRLSEWWRRQQLAVESVIGDRITSAMFDIVDFFDGTERLVAHYYTDARTHTEIDELNHAVLDAVAQVYEAHPDGPGAFLGSVVITVHGPEIPIEELDP